MKNTTSSNRKISLLTVFAFTMSFKSHVFLSILVSFKCSQSTLLYPQFTVMQLIGSLSVPITDLPPSRKVYFDWGLQMNYDMPYNLSSFYMVPIWAKNGSRSFLLSSLAVHELDFTASELYQGLENMLERYGFDRSCLKQLICELSQHPFDEDSANILTDAVNFLLKPSIHQGFSSAETFEKTTYSLAENQGFLGENCQQLYPQCLKSLLNSLTMVIFMNNEVNKNNF